MMHNRAGVFFTKIASPIMREPAGQADQISRPSGLFFILKMRGVLPATTTSFLREPGSREADQAGQPDMVATAVGLTADRATLIYQQRYGNHQYDNISP